MERWSRRGFGPGFLRGRRVEDPGGKPHGLPGRPLALPQEVVHRLELEGPEAVQAGSDVEEGRPGPGRHLLPAAPPRLDGHDPLVDGQHPVGQDLPHLRALSRAGVHGHDPGGPQLPGPSQGEGIRHTPVHVGPPRNPCRGIEEGEGGRGIDRPGKGDIGAGPGPNHSSRPDPNSTALAWKRTCRSCQPPGGRMRPRYASRASPRKRASERIPFTQRARRWRRAMSVRWSSRASSSSSSAGRPPAMQAPTRAPMLVPRIPAGRNPTSSRARQAPTWASPLRPPPPRTSQGRGPRCTPPRIGPSSRRSALPPERAHPLPSRLVLSVPGNLSTGFECTGSPRSVQGTCAPLPGPHRGAHPSPRPWPPSRGRSPTLTIPGVGNSLRKRESFLIKPSPRRSPAAPSCLHPTNTTGRIRS
jgi:hypothetical protein